MTRPPTKTAKDFIEMKKQETPAQPQIIPDAVADFFLRLIGTGKRSKRTSAERRFFPCSLGTVKIIVVQPPPN